MLPSFFIPLLLPHSPAFPRRNRHGSIRNKRLFSCGKCVEINFRRRKRRKKRKEKTVQPGGKQKRPKKSNIVMQKVFFVCAVLWGGPRSCCYLLYTAAAAARKGEGFFCGQTAVVVVAERKVSGAGPVSGTRRRSSGKRTYGEEEIAKNNVNFAD